MPTSKSSRRRHQASGARRTRRYTLPVLLDERLIRKVPAITLLFWVVKVLTTAQGEALSDYLVHTIDPYIAVGLGALGITVALAIQLYVRRYIAWAYWFAVTMVAVFGTPSQSAYEAPSGLVRT